LVGKPLAKLSLGGLRNTEEDISEVILRGSENGSLVETDRRFRAAYCLHHQGDK
jgi:hypothetical protein